MANDKICVFCGEKTGAFRTTYVICGGAYQTCCKECAKEVNDLTQYEQCRRALKLGLASYPEMLEKYIKKVDEEQAIADKAEEHRPSCLRCGKKLRFQQVEYLDNSPLRDGLLSTTFDVLPAFCESCGKYEFFNPEVIEKNPYLAHLIKTDTEA